VIVCKSPENPAQDFVKRAICLSGADGASAGASARRGGGRSSLLRTVAQTVRTADPPAKVIVARRQKYFKLDPGHLVEAWLFDGLVSYVHNSSAIFGKLPSHFYGYYSPCEHALIVNMSTGYGMIVHEMVHPFMEANIPDCPPWFNEGLASLYEQPSDAGGHLRGSTD
jgi:hypothetical protein